MKKIVIPVLLVVSILIFGLHPVIGFAQQKKALSEIIDVIPVWATLSDDNDDYDNRTDTNNLKEGWQWLKIGVMLRNKTNEPFYWYYSMYWEGGSSELSKLLKTVTDDGYEYDLSGFYPNRLDMIMDVIPPMFTFYEYNTENSWTEAPPYEPLILVFEVPKARSLYSLIYTDKTIPLTINATPQKNIDAAQFLPDTLPYFQDTLGTAHLPFSGEGIFKIESFDAQHGRFTITATAQNTGGQDLRFLSNWFHISVIDSKGRIHDLVSRDSIETIPPFYTYQIDYSIEVPRSSSSEPSLLLVYYSNFSTQEMAYKLIKLPQEGLSQKSEEVLTSEIASSDKPRHVYDLAGLFAPEVVEELYAEALRLRDEFNFDVFILTTDDSGGMSAKDYDATLMEKLGKDRSLLPDVTVFSIHLDLGEFYELSLGWWQSISLDYDSHHVNGSFQTVVAYLEQGDYNTAVLEYIGYVRRVLEAERANEFSGQATQATGNVLEAERANEPSGQATQATGDIHQAAPNSPVETYRGNSIAIEKRGRTNAERVRLRENPSFSAESLLLLGTQDAFFVEYEVQNEGNSWYCIRLDNGEVGFMMKRYITLDIE